MSEPYWWKSIPDALPLEFRYDETTRTLEVTFGDGSIIRYYDLDSRLAFLSKTNERRNRDFIQFLRAAERKQELLRERTVNLPEPNPNPLKYQQNGVGQNTPAWAVRWGHKT